MDLFLPDEECVGLQVFCVTWSHKPTWGGGLLLLVCVNAHTGMYMYMISLVPRPPQACIIACSVKHAVEKSRKPGNEASI